MWIGSILLTSTLAQAAPPEKRLIQWGERPDQIGWLEPHQIERLSHDSHERGVCGGFFDITDYPDLPRKYLLPIGVLENRQPRHPAIVEPLLTQLSAENLKEVVDILSNDFDNRRHNQPDGVRSAQWVKNRFRMIASFRKDVVIEEVTHNFIQPSIIARIPGQGPKANEIVVIGGHQDSITGGFGGGGSRAPGADDNASGTATVLEIFRVLVESGFRPNRTLEFMAYAGEEAGLLGSQDISRRYQQANKIVAGVMQFDMTMYPGAGTSQITLISDNTNADLNRFVGSLIDTYLKISWNQHPCGYGCSDHASWHKVGYPAVFPFEAPPNQMNRQIHTPNDNLNVLDPQFGLYFAKIGLAFAVELAAD